MAWPLRYAPRLPLLETDWEVLEEYRQWLYRVEESYYWRVYYKQKQEDNKQLMGRTKDKIPGGILGLAVADALGVPVEFQDRESLRRNPVVDMRGYGTYNQPPGTWSDDTSLTLCLLDSLTKNRYAVVRSQPDYTDIMQRFLSWIDKAEYTAHGDVFDVGIATRKALHRFREGTEPIKCGGSSEKDNGNGSLMRILPLGLFFPIFDKVCRGDGPYGTREITSFYMCVHDVASLTHAHKRSLIACGIYLGIVRRLERFYDYCTAYPA